MQWLKAHYKRDNRVKQIMFFGYIQRMEENRIHKNVLCMKFGNNEAKR